MDVVNNHVIVFVLFPLSHPSRPRLSIHISFCGTSFAPLTSLLDHPLGQNAAIMRPLNNSSRARIRRIHNTHTNAQMYVCVLYIITTIRFHNIVAISFGRFAAQRVTGSTLRSRSKHAVVRPLWAVRTPFEYVDRTSVSTSRPEYKNAIYLIIAKRYVFRRNV